MRHALGVTVLTILAGSAVSCAPATNRGADGQGSIVTAEDVEQHPGEPIERLLERKVSGLEVIRTADGGFALRIRGRTSYDGTDRPPLYIMNGLPIQAGRDGAIPGLNLNDIESIRVLKGGDAAIYGIDGANGVIVITTKKG